MFVTQFISKTGNDFLDVFLFFSVLKKVIKLRFST